MKKFKITSCRHCPYLDAFWNNLCQHPNASGMFLYDIDKIADNCPFNELIKEYKGSMAAALALFLQKNQMKLRRSGHLKK